MYGSRAIFMASVPPGGRGSGAGDGEPGGLRDDLAFVGAELVLELLEGATAGFRHALGDEHDRADVDKDEQAERRARAGGLDELREDLRDRRVDGPQDEDGDAHREAADGHREDLREQQPDA